MKHRLPIRPPNGERNVLLHSCCAPCSGSVIEDIHNAGIDLTIYFYNPNIHPRKEYDLRKEENVRYARAGFDHAEKNFSPFPTPLPTGAKPQAVWTGNDALGMGGAAAGVKFYTAYPMSPATGVLHWMANNAPELGIMVRQIEDEIGVANVAIGASQMGCRSMCATKWPIQVHHLAGAVLRRRIHEHP